MGLRRILLGNFFIQVRVVLTRVKLEAILIATTIFTYSQFYVILWPDTVKVMPVLLLRSQSLKSVCTARDFRLSGLPCVESLHPLVRGERSSVRLEDIDVGARYLRVLLFEICTVLAQ